MAASVTHLRVASPVAPNLTPMQADDGSVRTPTSFGDYGIPDELVGSGFNPDSLFNSKRALELRFRASYFHCKQHDSKRYSWEGTAIGPVEMRTTQPFLGSSQASQYIPLAIRRPSVPYRLGRKIVRSFTDFLLGQGRWPQMRSKDAATQAAAEQLVETGEIPSRVMQARNLAGASGTAGISWHFVDGKPVVRAHPGASIHVVSWADEDSYVPAHVIELRQKTSLAVDPEDGQVKPTVFWHRRDWTQDADVVFEPVRVNSKEAIVWKVDDAESRIHGDGFCHFVWVQNCPSEDETEDGVPDYSETYEQQDGLDVLNSVNFKGVTLNLDPTLALTVSDEQESITTIRKGSDNALVLKQGGTAEYLQLSDTSIGENTIQLQRSQVLEVTGCVLLDPDKAAAAASSGEAQKMVYAPMIAATDFLRLQWGPAISRLMNQMLESWRNLRQQKIQVPIEPTEDDVPVLDEATGEQLPQQFEEYDQDLMLPERIVRERGPDGKEITREEPHDPGAGIVDVEWGPYFKPSGTERQAVLTGLGAAVGGRALLSQRTGVEIVSNLLDRDANEEWQAVQDEAAAARENEAAMLDPQQRGEDGDSAAGTAAVEIAPTDGVLVMKVNEVRKTMGQGPMLLPDGSPDPDGLISFVAYKAKMEAQQQVEGTAEGKENVGLPPAAPVEESPDDDLPVPLPRKLPGLGD